MHYMSERRDYVPIAVLVIVSEKLVRSLGGVPAAAEAGSLSWRWRFNMGLASRIKGVTRDTWQLDHDPSLALRKKQRRWNGMRMVSHYDPPANDPEYLFYRDDHHTKTFQRGDHGQYSDIVLIKRERRRNRPAKPKRKIASRPFPPSKNHRPFPKRREP